MDSEQKKAYANLLIQAMLFDMQVDWETGTLVSKNTSVLPIWIRRWREKEQGADRQPEDYEGGEDVRGR